MIQLQLTAEYLNAQGQAQALPKGLLACLQAVHAQGSITKAAAHLGLSYRTVWNLLQHAEQTFEGALVETQGRAGAQLSALGWQLLWVHQQAQARMAPTLDAASNTLNAQWLWKASNLPWLSMATSPDPLLQHLMQQQAMHQRLQLEIQWQDTVAALSALHRGEVKLAGCQLPDLQGEHTEVHQVVRRWLRGENLVVIRLFERQLGWMCRSSIRPTHLSDVQAKKAQLVNRSPADSSHHLLRSLAERQGLRPEGLPGFFHEEPTHEAMACSIAANHGDLGLGSQHAAHQYGLHFEPVAWEHHVWVLHGADLQFPGVVALREWLNLCKPTDNLGAFVGYQVGHWGQVHTLESFLNP